MENKSTDFRTHAPSHLFTLRLWREEVTEGRIEWRGKVQSVVDGETLYFCDWDNLLAFLNTTLGLRADGSDQGDQAEGE
jgi:hypothetical protein